MAKEYKSGQFVSICGELHRVKKTKTEEATCLQCPYGVSPRRGKETVCIDCISKLTYRQYPIPLKPKHQG